MHHRDSGASSARPVCSRPRLLFFSVFLIGTYLFVCCASTLYASTSAPAASFGSPLRLLRPLSAPTSAGASAEADEAAAKAATRAELGRSTWTLLHRLAAAFDKNPTPARSADAVQFFSLLSTLYPCPDCAAHLREALDARPVDARSNVALSLWLCALHNEVNVRLRKPVFPCELDALKEKWGSCGCFDNVTAMPALPAQTFA